MEILLIFLFISLSAVRFGIKQDKRRRHRQYAKQERAWNKANKGKRRKRLGHRRVW